MENYKARIDEVLVKKKKYQDPEFSAKQLAGELGVSAYQLSRILRTTYGRAYADIVHALRIEEAMSHLSERRFDPYTVDDIGVMVGFSNRQSFFQAFKKLAGTTPERFRHQQKRLTATMK